MMAGSMASVARLATFPDLMLGFMGRQHSLRGLSHFSMADPIAPGWKGSRAGPTEKRAFARRTQRWAPRNIWNQLHLVLLIE